MSNNWHMIILMWLLILAKFNSTKIIKQDSMKYI